MQHRHLSPPRHALGAELKSEQYVSAAPTAIHASIARRGPGDVPAATIRSIWTVTATAFRRVRQGLLAKETVDTADAAFC